MTTKADDIAQHYQRSKGAIATDPARRQDLLILLGTFIHENVNPATSPNFQNPKADQISCFIEMLTLRQVQRDAVVVLALLKCLKILSRKSSNRSAVGNEGVCALLMNLSPSLNTAISAEGSSVLLNICYEPSNVAFLLRTPGVQMLIDFLAEEDPELQANAAGAIQSVCFLPDGREHVLELDGVQALLARLSSSHANVVIRASGAVHNLSSEEGAIEIIRQYGGIPQLIGLLSSDLEQVPGSAAGVLQNISRELSSRLLIKALDAVPPLARLLSSSDVQAQVCAAGALLNIIGPEMYDFEGGESQRRAMGRILSLIMSSSQVHSAVFKRPPDIGELP